MARYSVGEELFVIHFTISSSRVPELFSAPLRFWNEDVSNITIKKLVVTEHHRVLHDYAKEDEAPTCDGFILKDEFNKELVSKALWDKHPDIRHYVLKDIVKTEIV